MSARPGFARGNPLIDGVARRQHLAALLGILGAIAFVYARSSGFGFVLLDDLSYVVVTRQVRDGLSPEGILWAFTTLRGSMWMPLTWLSYMAEIEWFGINPGIQHVTNLVLHAVSSLLFYALCVRLLERRFAAWAAAMLFAIHPVHVESVVWIAERKDVLFGVFYIGALLAFVRWRERPGRGNYIAMLLLGACAMMSKPMAVSLPVVMGLLCFWPPGGVSGHSRADGAQALRDLLRSLVAIAPVAVMAAATGVLTILAARVEFAAPEYVGVGFRFGNAAYSVAIYLWKLVLPLGLAPMYPLRSLLLFQELLPAAAVVAAVSVLAWRCRHSRPWIAIGWLWFLVALVPVSGLFQVGNQARADRFLYISVLGIYLALGAELARAAPAWFSRLRLVVAGALLLYACLAWIQVGYWANPLMFYTRMLEVGGENVDARVGLAQFYLDAGDIESAAKNAEAAVLVAPGHYAAFSAMGNVALARNEYALAESMFRKAIQHRSDYVVAWWNLSLAVRRQGREAEADELRKTAEALSRDEFVIGQSAPGLPAPASTADPGTLR